MLRSNLWLSLSLSSLLCLTAASGPALAQETEEPQDEETAAAAVAEEDEEAPDQEMAVEEVIVVTASRTEQPLHEVPAAVSVLTSEEIDDIPADDYGDYLRNIPGTNVAQMSARDIQVTTRGATNSLAASQLVLLDGRTLYLDFFGFVMWDFLPVNPREIKQIEVVRGPGSAVWGANAMTGVINLITKSPREMAGTSVVVGAGELSTAFGSVSHASAGDKVGYKLSASYYEQDPFDRPTGIIPGSAGPLNPGGTPYPPFENQGTKQPKVDVRVDYDASMDTTWRFSSGWATTDGIIHSGIGPFDIDSGSSMSYFKADWNRRAAQVRLFGNLLDGEATNLLAVDPLTFEPLGFDFQSDTYHLEGSNTSVVGEHNVFTYGANYRDNDFDLSIAPEGDSRQEWGIFLQDEILLGDRVRLVLGARLDDIDPIDTVFSPRASVLYSPTPRNTFRASFNRAFRAPSMINNFLSITTLQTATIPMITLPPPFPPIDIVPEPTTVFFPVLAIGNVDLSEERLDAYEVGWVGTFDNGLTVTASAYRNETTDSIDFFASGFYSSASPPLGWPLDPLVLDLLAGAGNPLPSTFSYRNIGEIEDMGVELSFNQRMRSGWSWNFNYSWQDESDVSGIEQVTLPNGEVVDAVNVPPEHRANLTVAYDAGGWYANSNVNYQDEAFWTDVLDSRFWGPTDSFTSLSLGGGVRLSEDRVILSVTAQNVFDEDIQQHVFGDIISRKVTGQLTFNF